MDNDKIEFVLLGAGSIAGKYVAAVNSVPDASITAVVSRRIAKAEQFAQKHSIGHSSDSLESLAQKVDFDAVIIATPSGLHADGAIRAAKLKKHVLCEKPLDITLEKIDAMTTACESAGVRLGCAFQHRTADHNKAAYEAVQAGKLGKIYIANSFLKKYRAQEYYDSAAWRGTWELDGGGPFIQQAAHTLDLMVWMMGRAKSVVARTATVAHDIEVEDMGHAIVEYENGARGVLEASTVIRPGYPNKIEIHGEKGSIILTDGEIVDWSVEGLEAPQFEGISNVSGATDPMAIGTQGHERIVADFVDAIRQNREPMIPPASARLSVELILALYESARQGKAIQLQ
ncbi:MAG: Gfo/Idh/MocA family protein [Planctomycetota bacterium]|jgi:predicted dehydrogenase